MNLKRILVEILSENIGSNKRIKGDNSNAISASKCTGTIVKYHVIFKDLFITRVSKFKNSVGHFVLELLNTMKNILVTNDSFINPRKVRNSIDTFIINKY